MNRHTEDILPVYIIGTSSREVVGWRVDLCGGSLGGGQDLGLIWALEKGGVELWLLKALAVVWPCRRHWLHWHLRTTKITSQGSYKKNC